MNKSAMRKDELLHVLLNIVTNILDTPSNMARDYFPHISPLMQIRIGPLVHPFLPALAPVIGSLVQ